MGGIPERAAMNRDREAEEAWNVWRDSSRKDAERRWNALLALERPQKSGKEWLDATRRRLIELTKIGILQPRESGRVRDVVFSKLAASDQDRLKKSGFARDLFAFAVAAEQGGRAAVESGERSESLARHFLRLNTGKRLGDGRLSFQVFVKESTRLPVGMNIQICGTDPTRAGRPTYLRYDLDVVAMGTGPVTHFNAHWHAGDDPDGNDAEDHDPRLPSLLLDPVAVLDVLIETFFPDGPDDVAEETATRHLGP